MSWWTDKLQGGTPTPPPAPAPMYAPAQQQMPQPQAQPQQQMPPADGSHIPAGQAWQMWKGGKGVADAKDCPSCGSGEFFSRTNTDGGMPSRNGPPAPQCFSCGYPIVQFASNTGTGGSSQTIRQQSGEVAGKAREAPGFAGGAHLNQIIGKA